MVRKPSRRDVLGEWSVKTWLFALAWGAVFFGIIALAVLSLPKTP